MDKIAAAWATILEELGYDRTDPHLKDSPARVSKYMREWHTNKVEPPQLTTFPNDPPVDELVAVGGIRFTSVCAHHGLLFVGTAAVGYIPGTRVLGLSKFARVIDHFSRRFQVQERLTHEIAAYLEEKLGDAKGIGVVMRAEHSCMSNRGAKAEGAETITSVMRGVFRNAGDARAELFALLKKP